MQAPDPSGYHPTGAPLPSTTHRPPSRLPGVPDDAVRPLLHVPDDDCARPRVGVGWPVMVRDDSGGVSSATRAHAGARERLRGGA